jgi:LacI family transcriptional regulator
MMLPTQSQIPTLQDVARRAGVSSATVSRCMNGTATVKPETRARVEQAIAALGYTPHFGARALASNRTGIVGVVIPTAENAIFALGIQAMEEALSEHSITLLMATSGYDSARELEKIRALVARGIDGLALIGFERPKEVYTFLAARSVPFVLLWNYVEDSPYPCIGFDNREAAAAMARHVLAFGHRRVAMIAGLTGENDRARERVFGVRAALEAKGLHLAADRLIECRYSIAEAEAAARHLLAAPDPPTAILCGNDVLAAGTLRGARRAGLSVPEDVSIVGFDDIDLASAVEPPLTTMRVPHRRMGRAAARVLITLHENQSEGECVQFRTEIVERLSLASPSAGPRADHG